MKATKLKSFFIFSGTRHFWGYVAAWLVFILLSLWIVPYHEIWADEAQALLIAQETSVYDIITKIPHNEMHPSLWYLLLKLFYNIFGVYLNIAYISVFIMAAAVGVLFFGYKVPVIYKILLPFGHYFLYQYNIISRNYCLAYLALALLGVLYHKRHSHHWSYACVLLLLAESTFILAPVSAVLGLFWIAEAYKFHRYFINKYIFPFGLLVIAGFFTLWQVFPFNQTLFAARIDHIGNTPVALPLYFAETFFLGESSLLNLIFFLFILFFTIKNAIQPSFYDLIRQNKNTVMQFITIWGVFCLTYSAICPMYYHQGLIWGLFLGSVYMFFTRYVCRPKHYFFLACVIMHVFWSIKTVAYDVRHAYSAQSDTTALLMRHSAQNVKMAVAGYHTLPLRLLFEQKQLYFAPDETLYYTWVSPEELRQQDLIQNIINQHRDILVIDVTQTDGVDLSYYQNPEKFHDYFIPAATTYKGYLFFEQGVRLYIKKDTVA